jgi:hypothetical protein
MRASRLSLILALVVMPAFGAAAQTLPWPTNPAASASAASGPPGAPPPYSRPLAMPPAMSTAPQPGFVAAPVGIPGGGASPFGGAGQAPGGMPPCFVEFTKLREDVEKKGKAAKAASERKVTREEMCKQITTYAAAELKWVKFTESSAATCGIPTQIAQQLKTAHGHTEETREKICSGPSPAAAAAPSLADALGTTRLPTPETTKTGKGTLDTLTGNAIQK